MTRHLPWLTALLLLLLCPTLWAEQNGSVPPPQRIVSLGPLNTENIYLLGAGDRLVGNTSYCVRPEAARDIEKIGSVMQVNIEQIVRLRPDLILTTGLTQPQQVRKLESLGLRVVQVKQPSSFTEICTTFLTLGRILGLEERAQAIITAASKKVSAVQNAVANLPPQKVFLQVGAQPLFASVKSSFTHDYIALAGGINIAGDALSGMYNREKVIVQNPDVIIIGIMGTENGIGSREKAGWLQYKTIAASRSNRVHILNPDLLCSPSPLTFTDTLAIVAQLIHPEADIDTSALLPPDWEQQP